MNVDTIGYIGGAISSLSLLFQICKTFQQKSGNDLSWYILIMNLSGSLFIATYGFLIRKPVIYYNISLSIICFVILLVMKAVYNTDKKVICNTIMV